MRTLLLSIILVISTLSLSSCKKEKAENQAKKDRDIILKYISDNGLTADSTESGIYYVIDSIGSGNRPNANSNVRVAYKGYFVDKVVFDESNSNGITFNLNQVIKGWTEGMQLFKEGGAGTLIIPSRLGYGDSNRGSIPANSVLIFDVHLIEIL